MKRDLIASAYYKAIGGASPVERNETLHDTEIISYGDNRV
jgi:hypothetical protein